MFCLSKPVHTTITIATRRLLWHTTITIATRRLLWHTTITIATRRLLWHTTITIAKRRLLWHTTIAIATWHLGFLKQPFLQQWHFKNSMYVLKRQVYLPNNIINMIITVEDEIPLLMSVQYIPKHRPILYNNTTFTMLIHGRKFSGLHLNSAFWGWLSVESQPQNAALGRW